MGTRVNGVELLRVAIDTDHDSLPAIKGGTSGMFYHVTSSINTLLTSGAQGDIIFHDGTKFARLNAGTSGYLLRTRNSGYDPLWVTTPAGDHEGLTGLLGGTSGMHYHLTSSDNTLLTSGAQGDIIYYDGTKFARLGAGTSGYLLETKNSGYDPVWVAQPTAGMKFNAITGTTQTAAANNGYISLDSGLVTVTLPATAAIGVGIGVIGFGSGKWKLAQNNASCIIYFISSNTTLGTGGYISATTAKDCVTVRCVETDTTWVVENATGQLGMT